MANDEFDNRRTDDEMLRKLHAPPDKHPDARIDIRTWPHRCEIYLNRPALDDLIEKLQTVVKLTLPSTKTCIMLADSQGKTLLGIATDDRSTPS